MRPPIPSLAPGMTQKIPLDPYNGIGRPESDMGSREAVSFLHLSSLEQGVGAELAALACPHGCCGCAQAKKTGWQAVRVFHSERWYLGACGGCVWVSRRVGLVHVYYSSTTGCTNMIDGLGSTTLAL